MPHRLLLCSRLLMLAVLVLLGATVAAQGPPARTAAPAQQTPSQPVAKGRPRADALRDAARLDQLLAKGVDRCGLEPSGRIDDATFVRRAYLQVVGHIPTVDEVDQFLADQSPDKRPALIDRLLDSPGYTSNEANAWFDLLRVKSRQRQLSGEPFAHWIRASIQAGKPYDEFVRDLLTATGPAHAEGNGATGYLLRDANMPHDAMANTLRLFAGTRVECAQCHNHPFDKWSQRDFYAMAAFFGGLRYRIDLDQELVQQLRRATTPGDDRQKQAIRRMLLTMSTGIAGSGTGAERLPADYKYDDAHPNDLVHAATIFGAEARLPKPRTPATSPTASGQRPRALRQRQAPPAEIDSRTVFAEWLTDARNARFTRVAVNRTWQRLFGRGLIEPIDDLKDDTVAVHPELEAALEHLLVALHFDLRQFERVLLLTRLFQQETLAGDPPTDTPYAFAAPLLRRLSAEQLWDSLLTLSVDDLDQHLPPTDARAREAYDRHAELSQGTPAQIAARLEQQDLRFADPQRFRELERERQQAMAESQPARTREQQRQVYVLQRELVAARRRGDTAAVDRAQRELVALGVPLPGGQRARARDGELLRASDLLQPAPPNHLLREFGQSDRETMDGATRTASVPQALTLLNGPIPGGAASLQARLARVTDPADRIHIAFLATLSRPPHTDEADTWALAMQRQPGPCTQDLLWVLLNSDEFRFCR